MQPSNSAQLPVGVRIYPERRSGENTRPKSLKKWRRPKAMLVFDTETRTDATQSLIFGSYRYCIGRKCIEEGLFYADDIATTELEALRRYVSTHSADSESRKLILLTKSEFLKMLYRAAYKGRCLLVGFNLSFDLSRLSFDVTTARGRFSGGFSLGLWSYLDKQGRERRNQYRPRVVIKHIDSKRALRRFSTQNEPDAVDLIPDDADCEDKNSKQPFRGNFLDLRTLAFALTDRGYTLESACKAFGTENEKTKAAVHGVVTEEYIEYNRRDVQATSELAIKLLEEYDRHPITLQPTKAYSPASIGKAYLRAMGIVPVLERQPDFPKYVLGYAQSAFFGGRTSAHIRKVAVPVVYTDFLSMYPTVNSLMNLWRFVVAREIRCVEHCAAEIIDFLKSIAAADLFNPSTWKKMLAFVKVIPNGDILPNRSKYSEQSKDWQVGLNHLYATEQNGKHEALWFSLPDVVASVILTGRVPDIVDAFRIEPVGLLPELTSVKLRGQIEVDPRSEDFFKVVIEQRKSLKRRADLSETEKGRLEKLLKVLANSSSYGIYAEMNAQESDERVRVTCHGIDREEYQCDVARPEEAGEFCFPPFASMITGAARLMLALLERSVTDLGGTYAMEDTDSMAIVATKEGGLIPCPGGPLRTPDGADAIKTLSWQEVRDISDRFAKLNSYCRDLIPGSVLKIEEVNFDPVLKTQRQLYCFAISAKRYALFLLNTANSPELLRKGTNSDANGWKEHGLGHLLNPSDPESEDRDWTGQIWLNIIRRLLGVPTSELPFTHLPAVGRVNASSPAVMKALADFNKSKHYRDQIKPFNFLLSVQTMAFGHPTGVNPNRFHLVAPFETNPRKWLGLRWIDQYTGKPHRVTTDGHTGNRNIARVKTYGDVLVDYEYHPESKCADAEGNVCGKQTVGLLRRRHVGIDRIVYIGKESNRLEEVESGMVQDEDSVYTEYPDPRRDEWATVMLPDLKRRRLVDLVHGTGLSRRTLIELRAGRSRPHPRNQRALKAALKELD
jgi:hypothetical protein